MNPLPIASFLRGLAFRVLAFAAAIAPTLAMAQAEAKPSAAVSPPLLGINVGGNSPWTTALHFADLMRNAREWMAPEGLKVEEDAEGWPVRLRNKTNASIVPIEGTNAVRTWLYGRAFTGEVALTWEGDGEVAIEREDATLVEDGYPERNRRVYRWPKPIQTPFHLVVRRSAADRPVRAIRLVPRSLEGQASVFNPLAVERLKPFGFLRFAGWSNIGYLGTADIEKAWKPVEWTDRVLPSALSHAHTAGVVQRPGGGTLHQRRPRRAFLRPGHARLFHHRPGRRLGCRHGARFRGELARRGHRPTAAAVASPRGLPSVGVQETCWLCAHARPSTSSATPISTPSGCGGGRRDVPKYEPPAGRPQPSWNRTRRCALPAPRRATCAGSRVLNPRWPAASAGWCGRVVGRTSAVGGRSPTAISPPEGYFWWEGVDGSRVLAFRIFDPYWEIRTYLVRGDRAVRVPVLEHPLPPTPPEDPA